MWPKPSEMPLATTETSKGTPSLRCRMASNSTLSPEMSASRFLRPSACNSSGIINSGSHCPAASSAVYPKMRSEEHTSELQSQSNLVCRLLLEKKKKQINNSSYTSDNGYTCTCVAT